MGIDDIRPPLPAAPPPPPLLPPPAAAAAAAAAVAAATAAAAASAVVGGNGSWIQVPLDSEPVSIDGGGNWIHVPLDSEPASMPTYACTIEGSSDRIAPSLLAGAVWDFAKGFRGFEPLTLRSSLCAYPFLFFFSFLFFSMLQIGSTLRVDGPLEDCAE